jgi:2-methylcitrate dehydratase PrpD
MPHTFAPIADFVFGCTPPDSARSMAALLLVDTLGVAAGACDLAPARIARAMAAQNFVAAPDTPGAPLPFDGRRLSVPGVAFAAATQIDNLDGHDGYNPTKGHIGCAVVPALLAFAADKPDLSSRKALDTLVMSYEIGARAAIALHRTVSDYHTSGAWNALAVAALGCRLLGADHTTLREALGIAEYHGPRSQMMREIANPTMLHDGSGMGAMTGAMAALLAVQGFQGAPAITVEAEDVRDIWADLGQSWTIERNYIKPYPICRWAHAPLDAVHALMRDHGLTHENIVSVEICTFAESAALYPGVPSTTSQAQYSLPFAVAAMLAKGHVGPAEISGPGLADPLVAALLDKIDVREDDGHSAKFPAHRCADVTLRLTNGETLQSGDVEARGGPEAPLSEDEVEAKLMLFAEPTLGHDRAQHLWSMRHDLLAPDHRFSDLVTFVSHPV